jgi:hypothetical protein
MPQSVVEKQAVGTDAGTLTFSGNCSSDETAWGGDLSLKIQDRLFGVTIFYRKEAGLLHD